MKPNEIKTCIEISDESNIECSKNKTKQNKKQNKNKKKCSKCNYFQNQIESSIGNQAAMNKIFQTFFPACLALFYTYSPNKAICHSLLY